MSKKISRRNFLKGIGRSVPALIVPPLILKEKIKEPVKKPVQERVAEQRQVINQGVAHMLLSGQMDLTSFCMSEGVDFWFPDDTRGHK